MLLFRDYYYTWILFRDYYVAFQGLLLYLDCFQGLLLPPSFVWGLLLYLFQGLLLPPAPLICMGIITVFHFRDYYYPLFQGLFRLPLKSSLVNSKYAYKRATVH
jgi:hypothetical protein